MAHAGVRATALGSRLVMIVGAGRGIGRAAAELFAAAGGYDLALAARNEAELAELAFKIEKRHHACALAVPTDVCNTASVLRLVDETLRRFNRIDTLIYCAGAGVLKPFAETTIEEFDRLMEVNVRGMFSVCQAVLPVMERRKGGRVVALPGVLGHAPMMQAAADCASKFALTGMLKALALEYKSAGVSFSLLHLSSVNTDFWDAIRMRVRRERMLTAEAAARAVFSAATQESEGVADEITLQPAAYQY